MVVATKINEVYSLELQEHLNFCMSFTCFTGMPPFRIIQTFGPVPLMILIDGPLFPRLLPVVDGQLHRTSVQVGQDIVILPKPRLYDEFLHQNDSKWHQPTSNHIKPM
jgi:hypothetical protein